MNNRVAVLAGDGIGPEVTGAAVSVLRAALPSCIFVDAPVGATAIASHGTPLPDEALAIVRDCDAIMFGAVGGPGFDDVAPEQRPEAALLALRKTFGLYANVRPARVFAGLEHRSPLRDDLVRGMDCVIIRELTGGLYFGPKHLGRDDAGRFVATDTLIYRDFEIERIARFAFELAQTRRYHVTSVDKANVLVSSQLWRRIVTDVAREYSNVSVSHVLVDNAAMQLLRDPCAFDVIVTDNMFGDILSDEAAMIAGTIGTAASASLASGPNDGGFGLYEPISGTAPDIAGKGIANPVAAILSAAMLARHSLGQEDVARNIEQAVAETLSAGPRTADLDAVSAASTTAFTEAVIGRLSTAILR